MFEEWKDILGYEGLYKVSNNGKILSINYGAKNHVLSGQTKLLKTTRSSTGYLHVQLYKAGKVKTFLVHRLVANAFLPNPTHLKEINHKDGNKENNSLENLEWVSRKQNLEHAVRTGLKRRAIMKGRTGESNPLSKPVKQITLDGQLIKTWGSSYDASKEGGFSQDGIRRCASGHAKSHKNYIWKYVGD